MKAILIAVICFFLISDYAGAAELNVAHLDQQVGVGYGFNPVTGEFHPPCIEVDAGLAGKTVVSNPKVTTEIKRLSSTSEMKKELNFHAYSSVFGATGEASVELASMVGQGVSSSDSYFSVEVKVEGNREVINKKHQDDRGRTKSACDIGFLLQRRVW